MDRKAFLKAAAVLAGGVAGLPFGTGEAFALDGSGFAARLAQAAADGDDAFWRVVRSQFVLDPDWTFLNFGGLGACPLPVLNALADATATRNARQAPAPTRSTGISSRNAWRICSARAAGKTTWRSSRPPPRAST